MDQASIVRRVCSEETVRTISQSVERKQTFSLHIHGVWNLTSEVSIQNTGGTPCSKAQQSLKSEKLWNKFIRQAKFLTILEDHGTPDKDREPGSESLAMLRCRASSKELSGLKEWQPVPSLDKERFHTEREFSSSQKREGHGAESGPSREP